MSCHGCRVLRKGCSEDCVLKHCLKWIENPQSQANATLFLSKFYGRAGLLNLITSAPHHLHPDIFKSLLYEACGRMINPIYGGVGLMWTGNWLHCQAAVEAVLEGSPIFQIPLINEEANNNNNNNNNVCPQPIMPLQGYNIRHAPARKNSTNNNVVVNRRRTHQNNKKVKGEVEEWMNESTKFSITGWELNNNHEGLTRVTVERVEPCLVDFYLPYNNNNNNRNFEIYGTSSKTNEVSLELKLTLPLYE